ncbi:hypothetical protein ABW636_07450 [Aquimarina sp. 2201CG1-2-11]|uniref:hypothetical protein n=1 Tax=Aquimarina discodermiae TaxID=3231043 RepID=UPI003462F2B0
MKSIKHIFFLIIALLICNSAIHAQNSHKPEGDAITGTFDDYDGVFYTFNYINDDMKKDVISFAKIHCELRERIDLTNEKYIGRTFNISYELKTETEIDEDGSEEILTTRTIVNLELLD